MTDEQLAAIEARAAAATPGPWFWQFRPREFLARLVSGAPMRPFVMAFGRWGMWSAKPLVNVNDVMVSLANHTDHPDAAFIAHARTDVPALVAEVRRLRDRVALLEGEGGLTLFNLMELHAALRDRARAVVAEDTYTTNAGYQRCRRCSDDIPHHAPDCTIGALAAALDGEGVPDAT